MDGEHSTPLNMGILDEDVGFQIHLTRRAMWQALRAGRKEEKRQRYPSGVFSCLILIGHNPGISQRELAKTLYLDPPNVAVILNLMNENEWIERHPAKEDRRKHELSLTAKGQEMLETFYERRANSENIFQASLTADERATVVSCLKKIQDHIKD